MKGQRHDPFVSGVALETERDQPHVRLDAARNEVHEVRVFVVGVHAVGKRRDLAARVQDEMQLDASGDRMISFTGLLVATLKRIGFTLDAIDLK